MAYPGRDPGAEPNYTPRPNHHDDRNEGKDKEYGRVARLADPPTPASPSELSSPSLSWPSPLMSPFSPGRGEGLPFNDPNFPSSPELAKSSPGGQGQKDQDVLIQRLNALASRLQHNKGYDLEAMNASINKMELSLMERSPRPILSSATQNGHSVSGAHVGSHDNQDQNPLASAHCMPPESSPIDINALDTSELENKESGGPKMSLEHAQRIVNEANELNRGLQAAINSFRARQEESEHIHDLLVTRAERAAQHIIYLENKVKDLEHERDEGEMEVLSLQIQLKAIEVQSATAASNRSMISDAGADTTAPDDDPDLRDSISSWKAEWSELRRKRARKKDGGPSAEDGGRGDAYFVGSSAVATPESSPLKRVQQQEGGGNRSRSHRRGGSVRKLVHSSPSTPLGKGRGGTPCT